MAYESGALNAALAAAVGSDPVLVAELRSAFVDSATGHIDLLRRARCDANWHFAALRLKSLGASFGVQGIVDLADRALEGAPGDPVVLRLLDAAMRDFDDHPASPR
jgi:HPt (histidine-containing phosphotransfer) domain-containing protein